MFDPPVAVCSSVPWSVVVVVSVVVVGFPSGFLLWVMALCGGGGRMFDPSFFVGVWWGIWGCLLVAWFWVGVVGCGTCRWVWCVYRWLRGSPVSGPQASVWLGFGGCFCVLVPCWCGVWFRGALSAAVVPCWCGGCCCLGGFGASSCALSVTPRRLGLGRFACAVCPLSFLGRLRFGCVSFRWRFWWLSLRARLCPWRLPLPLPRAPWRLPLPLPSAVAPAAASACLPACSCRCLLACGSCSVVVALFLSVAR